MSKCIKCGRKLTSGETLEIYSGMCGKCYEEQYDKFVKKIDGKYLFGVIEKPLRQQIDQLKQQLENLKSKLREANREKNKNKFFEEKNKEKREKDNKLLEETMASNSKLNLENIVLKQQLEEKDKEIANLQVLIIENKNDVKEMREFKIGDNDYDLTDEDARNDIKCQIENQTQLAIQELQKLKDYYMKAIIER